MEIGIKRVYEPPAESDGRRILVDRLWPRGLSKEAARLDGWLKDVAPSPQLRLWFGHQEERFEEFRRLYRLELENDADKQAALRQLLAMGGSLTLLYGAKDTAHNQAVVLREYLLEKGDGQSARV